jgi:hypothetical protein
MKDLISSSTHGQFRDLMTDSTVGAIGSAFRDEGFAPNPDTSTATPASAAPPPRNTLDSVAWSDPGHVARACRVFERLLTDWSDGPYLQRFYSALRETAAYSPLTG